MVKMPLKAVYYLMIKSAKKFYFIEFFKNAYIMEFEMIQLL